MPFDPTTAIPVIKRPDGLLEKNNFNPTTALPVEESPTYLVADKNWRSRGFRPPLTDQDRARATVELMYRSKGQKLPLKLKIDWALTSETARAGTAATMNTLLTGGLYPVVQALRGIADNKDDYSLMDRVTKGILYPEHTARLTDKVMAEDAPTWAKITQSVSEDILSYGVAGLAVGAAKGQLVVRDLARKLDKAGAEFAAEKVGTVTKAEGVLSQSPAALAKRIDEVKNGYIDDVLLRMSATDTRTLKTGFQEFAQKQNILGMLAREIDNIRVSPYGLGSGGLNVKIGQKVSFTNPEGKTLIGKITELQGERAIIDMEGRQVVAMLSQLRLPDEGGDLIGKVKEGQDGQEKVLTPEPGATPASALHAEALKYKTAEEFVANKITTPDNVKFNRSGDAVGKEYHETIQAIDKKTGEVLGYVDYVYSNKQNSIKMIEVKPEYRGKKIASALLNEMQQGAKTPFDIVGDYMTNEGKKFLSSYKTKSQLTTIWNEAHGKIKPPEVPPIEAPPTESEAQPPKEPRARLDLKGIKRLSEELKSIEDIEEKRAFTKESLANINDMRREFLRGIRKYKDDYLKEELAAIPRHYITREGGMTVDEAMQYLRDRGTDIANETEFAEYLKNLDDVKKSLEEEELKYLPEKVKKMEKTLVKDKLKVAESLQKEAQREMEKALAQSEKEAVKQSKVAFREGRKAEAELRKKKYFGSEITPDQRRELYVVALKKGLIYTDYSGKSKDKLQGLIRYYKGASFDQLKNYISSLSGNPENPSKLFKLYGDIDKDAEALKAINAERENWKDINSIEVYSLDPARIVEKVSGTDLWDGNILADNTFNVIASADEAMFDRKVLELGELDKHREGVFAGSKESAEIMRKFEAKETLTDKEQRIVNFLRSKYDKLIAEANQMRELVGKKPIPYRQDYMTHIIEANLFRDFFQGNEAGMSNITEAQMDAIRNGDYTKGNMPFNQFAQKRLTDKTKYDAIGNYTRYLNTILREVYLSPAIFHSRKFIQYALNKQPNAYKALDRLLNDLVGKVSIVDQNLIGNIAGSYPVKWLRTHIARSALVGNINFWTMNLSNFSTSYDELGNYLNIGISKFLFSKEWKDFAFKNSAMIKGRAIDPDFIDQPIYTKLEELVAGVTNLIEYNNIGSTFVGAYFKGIEEFGYSKEQAIEYADDIARRTQVGYKPYEVNAWMRSNSGKLMSQFQTWSFNAMNHILYDLGTANIPEDMASMFSDKKTNRTRWGAFLTLVVTAIMINALYHKMGLREPYQPGAAVPSIAGMDVGKYGDIGPARIAKDIVSAITSKKPETRKKATQRVAGSVVPGGAQAVRFMQGNVYPNNPDNKKKKKRIND